MTANPFPLEAVATYGQALQTCEELGFMAMALEQLENYLGDYPVEERRYGGAVGFAGGHGSGKTHLLMWLAQRAQGLVSLRPVVLYAKADSSRMFDVFKQLMGALPRERILHVLDEALKKIAVKEVGRARVTEGLARRIQDPEEFGKLFAEGNLDREQLFHILQAQLDSAEIPSTIPMTLVQVGSSSVGESAYAWLCGEEVRNLADLGLTHALVDEGKTLTRTAAPDVTAVNTLETIAALHKIAEIPFVIMFDQLEVFLRSDPDRQESGSSLLKKFIEQLGMQKALLFIAGSDASWRMLPADVAPRMRQRDPIIVGRLSEEETGALLDAYTGSRGTFTSSAVKTIHEVSGVNTREIIRTAHYAFEETDGEVKRASRDLVVRCAERSGTIADRYRVALGQADAVLRQHGDVVTELDVGDGIVIDRVVRRDGVPVLALVVLRASDQMSEIGAARRVNEMRRYLTERWPDAALLVVSVGYRSDEVAKLLRAGGTVVNFDETEFSGQLNSEITTVISRAMTRRAGSGTPTEIARALEAIASRLQSLEAQRAEEVQRIEREFVEKAQALNSARRQERDIKSRWQVLEELDLLAEALRKNDVNEERQLIRAVLVANETNVKDKLLDRLGGFYLDIASLAPLIGDPVLAVDSVRMRRDIILEMTRGVRRVSIVDYALSVRLRLVAMGTIGLAAGFMMFYVFVFGGNRDLNVQRLVSVGLQALAGAGVVVGYLFGMLYFFQNARLRKWSSFVERVRGLTVGDRYK